MARYLNFSLIDYVKVVALIALLDDGLAGQAVHWKHCIENVRSFVLV